jgi:hypothetical protein
MSYSVAGTTMSLGSAPIRSRGFTTSVLVYPLAAALAVALLLIPVNSLHTLFSEPVIVWGTTLITLALGVHGYRLSRRQGENPWLAPRSLLMLFFFFKFGWGSLVVYYWDSLPWEAVPMLRDRFITFGVRANLANACQLAVLGGLGLFLGLSLPMSRLVKAIPEARWTLDESKFRRNLVFYAPFALFVATVLRFTLPVSLQATVVTFGAVVTVMITVASQWLFSGSTAVERGKWAVFLLFAVTFSLVAGLSTGMVGEFLYPVVMMIWGYVIVKHRLPWKYLLVLGIAAFFLVFPTLTIYKYVAPSGTSLSIGERVFRARERMEMLDYRVAMELTFDRFVARATGMALPPVFIQHYPANHPFIYGESFRHELAALVPRVLWPGKLGLSQALNEYTAVTGIIADPTATSAVFDCLSEYYVNFGLAGVFFLCLVHGMYEKLLYYWLTTRTHAVIGTSIYAVFFILNHEIFGFGYAFTWHSRQIPAWLLIFYFLSRYVPRPLRARASNPYVRHSRIHR